MRITRKLLTALDLLIEEYGSDTVESALRRCEPFATQDREQIKRMRKITQTMFERDEKYVRSRKMIERYLSDKFAVHDAEFNDHVRIQTFQKEKDGRNVFYREKRKGHDDFYSWIASLGYVDDETMNDDRMPAVHWFIHPIKNQETLMDEEDELFLPQEGILSKFFK